MSEEIEQAVLAHALEAPTHGAQRVADELLLGGIQVSSGGVRGVWSRHGLTTKHERLLRLEETGLTPFWWTVESGCFCDQPKSGG